MGRHPLELFLDMAAAEKGASPRTLSAYESDLRQFLEFCKEEPQNITTSDVSAFMQELSRQAYSQKSQARKLSAIREFCRFLFSERILNDNPAQEVNAPKQEKPLPKFLTPAQIEQLCQQAATHQNLSYRRVGVMIELMFDCGLRVSELVGLSANAVNFDKRIIQVRGKGSKERIVPISERAVKALHNYETYRADFIAKGKSSDRLFPSKTAKEGHITRDMFFKTLKQLARECGLNEALISPHTLRHSFATNLINHDADLRAVQKMLGHENIATTEIYTHITPNRLVQAVQQKHPLRDFKPD